MFQSWNTSIAPMPKNNNLSYIAQKSFKRNNIETFCLCIADEHNC